MLFNRMISLILFIEAGTNGSSSDEIIVFLPPLYHKAQTSASSSLMAAVIEELARWMAKRTTAAETACIAYWDHLVSFIEGSCLLDWLSSMLNSLTETARSLIS